MEMKIGNKKIGDKNPAFIIAEISCNHMGKYENAAAIVRAAAEAGADAVKLQTYTADTMTIKCDNKWFQVRGLDNPESWQGLTLYQLYKEAFTPWEWQPKLQKLAEGLGMMLFSTPFDPTAVDFLEAELNPPCYKVASYELTDDTLLEAISKTGKPIILSNGYATYDELEHAILFLRDRGVKDIVTLYCVTEYQNVPTSTNVNLSTMKDIEEKFLMVTGLSDNNGGIDLPVMSVLYGGSVIEKHLMLHKGSPTYDERFSVIPSEFAEMVKQIRVAESLSLDQKEARLREMDPDGSWFGTPVYGPISELEKINTHLRRSLFVVEDIKEGEELTPKNVRSIRPQAEGAIVPRYYYEVMGKKAIKDIERGTPLVWELIN